MSSQSPGPRTPSSRLVRKRSRSCFISTELPRAHHPTLEQLYLAQDGVAARSRPSLEPDRAGPPCPRAHRLQCDRVGIGLDQQPGSRLLRYSPSRRRSTRLSSVLPSSSLRLLHSSRRILQVKLPYWIHPPTDKEWPAAVVLNPRSYPFARDGDTVRVTCVGGSRSGAIGEVYTTMSSAAFADAMKHKASPTVKVRSHSWLSKLNLS